MKKSYELEGMMSNACATNITGALLQLPEVLEADVQMNPQRAIVTMSKALDVAELQARINNVGQYIIKEVAPR